MTYSPPSPDPETTRHGGSGAPTKERNPMFVELDESDDDEDDEDIQLAVPETVRAVYDESSEPFPKSAAYDKAFHQATEDIENLVNEASNAIKGCNPELPYYQLIVDKIKELQDFVLQPKRNINIVGKSAAGKSTLLNCLLGRLKVAKANSRGRACTCVPTSYESSFPGQAMPVAAKIVLHTSEEIHKKMELLLRAYSLCHLNADKDWPEDEEPKIISAANTAIEAFCGMFCGRPEFQSLEAGHEFLGSHSGTPFGETVTLFVDWCKQLLAQYSTKMQEDSSELQSDPYYKEATTHDDLLEYIERWAFANPSPKEPTLWPLVKMIRQGFKHVNILQYANLVDWPGSDDTNQLRANAAAERIFDCDEVWIVSKVERIATEPAVKRDLQRYGSTTEVVVIGTAIDRDVNDDLAAAMQKDHDTSAYFSLRKEEERLENDIHCTEHNIEECRMAIEGGSRMTASGKRQKVGPKKKGKYEIKKTQLEIHLDSARKSLLGTSQRRFEVLFNIRKNDVRGMFTNAMGTSIPEREQPCLYLAANAHYIALMGGDRMDGPCLTAAATGIPALRTLILESAAPAISSTVQNYLDYQVSRFFRSLEMIVSPSSPEGYQAALKIVKNTRRRIMPRISAHLVSTEKSVDDVLVRRLGKKQDVFQVAALKIMDKKAAWKYSSIRAFVRNDGDHQTQTVPYESWNKLFIESVKDYILSCLDLVARDEQKALYELESMLTKECDNISSEMESNVIVFAKEQFTAFVSSQKKGVEQLCRAIIADCIKDFETIKFEAIETDESSAYFKAAMQEAWDACKDLSGPGAKDRIILTLQVYLKREAERSPFAVLTNTIQLHILNKAADRMDALRAGVEVIFGDVVVWLDAISHKNASNENDVELQLRIDDFLVRALPELRRVQDSMKAVIAKYK